ncbi:hypothetical protein FA15DRAFT_754695 [Coprinopsis marcescibilis]|uniref:Uncharacterized protein n=1 Tax=Coprinopsis marcescibilis TaxID=230819 RepID=A0A5C3LEF1_COPMA|nr:hypothetical protein FA15DRAFT_754695 [Coprinopsis marcescibilis]
MYGAKTITSLRYVTRLNLVWATSGLLWRPVSAARWYNGQGKGHAHVITSLDPKNLRNTNIIDISNHRASISSLRALDDDARPLDKCTDIFSVMALRYCPPRKFPASTRGVLYLHAPSKKALVPGASVRFRLVEHLENPTGFSSGRDLLSSDGKPWGIPLDRILRMPCYFTLRDVLVRDGLVTLATVFKYRLAQFSFGPRVNVLPSILDPFFMDFSCHKLFLQIVDKDKVVPFSFNRATDTPFSGTGIVQFELMWCGKKNPSVRLGLRVLEILTPPNPGDLAQVEGAFLKTTETQAWAKRYLDTTLPPHLIDELKRTHRFDEGTCP